jgi:glycine/D-amino acid oxidase-like deaminating enzyme
MKLTSYWLDTAEPAGDFRRNPLPSEVDVAVIGAGFTGLSAALGLAKQGASVAVLEQHTVGWGASGRNGGMATTGLAIGFSQAVERYGDRAAVAMFTEYNRAIDTIE